MSLHVAKFAKRGIGLTCGTIAYELVVEILMLVPHSYWHVVVRVVIADGNFFTLCDRFESIYPDAVPPHGSPNGSNW